MGAWLYLNAAGTAVLTFSQQQPYGTGFYQATAIPGQTISLAQACQTYGLFCPAGQQPFQPPASGQPSGGTGSGGGGGSPPAPPPPAPPVTGQPVESPPAKPITGPGKDGDSPPEEKEECECVPVRGVMGFVKSEKQYEEKNFYFPRSDSCDDPKQTEPLEVVRKVRQDVEWVPIIEVPKCKKLPPREEVPPQDENPPPPPASSKPITGDSASTGASSSSGSTGGSSSGSPARTQFAVRVDWPPADEVRQGGAGGRSPGGSPRKQRGKKGRGPSGDGGGGSGGNQGKAPLQDDKRGKRTKKNVCDCSKPPSHLTRKKEKFERRANEHRKKAAAARDRGAKNAANHHDSWADENDKYAKRVQDQIDAWTRACNKRAASNPACGGQADAGSKKFDPTRPDVPNEGLVAAQLLPTNLVSADTGNTHDYAASSAVMPNQAALPGDWKGEYNPSDQTKDIILPAAAVVPPDAYEYDDTDEPERSGTPTEALPAGDATGMKNPNAQGQDTPCRYVMPVPSYAGTEEQVAVQTVSPYNTPSAMTDGGFPFANNALPVIDISSGPISQQFFEDIVTEWASGNDTSGTFGDNVARVADAFAQLISEANGKELTVEDMAAALLAGVLDGADSDNEQFANAVTIVSAALLSQPRYLMTDANPSMDHRADVDNGNFVPSANRAIAYNGLPVAAPTPSGFNVGFELRNDKVIDSNFYRAMFNSEVAGSGGGAKYAGSIGVLIEDRIPASNNIMVNAAGIRALPDGRLDPNQLAPLIDSNANYDIVQRLQTQIEELEDDVAELTAKQIEADSVNDQPTVQGLQVQIDAINLQIQTLNEEIDNFNYDETVSLTNELLDAIATYQTDQSAWQAAYDARVADPTNSALQAAEGEARATVRADEANIVDLQNKLVLARAARANKLLGDVPDPNPSGVALPQPFMGQGDSTLIPSFSFELLQYEMAQVASQINNVFEAARQFVSDVRSALFDTVGRQTSNRISWTNNVSVARSLRNAATNEFNKSITRLMTQLGGGINKDGTFEQNLSDPVLTDGNGNARYAVSADVDAAQYSADLTAVTNALSLGYIAAGLNDVNLSGTATVPPTSGDELDDQTIADELGLGTPDVLGTLPEDLASKFVDMSNNAQQAGLETVALDDLNDDTIALQIARRGMRYQPFANMIKAWASVQPIQFPKKLSIWMFGGTLETKTFENTWVAASYRGVLNREMLSDVDRGITMQQLASNIIALKRETSAAYESLQQAKALARIQSIRDTLDPIRVAADNAVTDYTEAYDDALERLEAAQSAYANLRNEEPSNIEPTGQLVQRAIAAETPFAADTITLALGSIDSLTTQWANAQNTGFIEDKTDYLFNFFDTNIEVVFQNQELHIKSLLDRFLNVLIARYKLMRDSVQNSDDTESLPVVVDYQPGVITDKTPVGAAYVACRPLKVVYDFEPPVLTQKGNVIGGGLQPSAELPTFSLNPDFAYFTTDVISEKFVAGNNWDVVENYMIPELLAPGCTYSNVLPSPNAPEIHCLVNNAPYSFDLIMTVPEYVSGEIRTQILDGFHTMMRHFVGLFNASTPSQGIKNDENINTQIAVGFKYGNIDTFRLPRPLQQYEKLLGSNQAAVNIYIPSWNDYFAAGYNLGGYGSQFFDIAYKALRDAIKWARTYASNVETHLNQSVRAKLENKLVANNLPVPANLSEQFDFRLTTTITETPDQNHAVDPTDLCMYSMDVDVDFGPAFAELDIAGFGKIDSGAAGKFRNYFLHNIMLLRSSDKANDLLFGQTVFTAGKPMRLAFHSLASFFFAKAPFDAANMPRWRFGFHFGWDEATVPYADPAITDDTLANYFHAPDEPRTNSIKASGDKSNYAVSDQLGPVYTTPDLTLTGELSTNGDSIRAVGSAESFLIEQAPWDFPDVPMPALPTTRRKPDVMRAADFIGRALERFVQKIVFDFLRAIRRNALDSFAGTTVLWASNYGLIDQQRLLSLIETDGSSRFPDKIGTVKIDNQTLLVYPFSQPMFEEALKQSTTNTGKGPLTTEFQANNLGVLVTPEKHGVAPANAVWVPSGSNFGKNIGFNTFVDQLDQIINVQHAYNAMLSRGDWAGQHVLAKVIEKTGNAVSVVPITFAGRAAAHTRLNGRYKVNAVILGAEADIRVGDEVWLSHDLSSDRIAFVWPSPRTGNQNIDMSAVDIPAFTSTQLGNIPFLGQNQAGQFDGSGILGNIYTNALPALINTVNKLIAKGKFNNIETGSMEVIDGIGFITLENTYVGNPQVHLEVNAILSDPPGYEAFIKPLIYARVADTIEVRFYDASTGALAVKYDDNVNYMIVGSTVETAEVSGVIAQADMFRDAGYRN